MNTDFLGQPTPLEHIERGDVFRASIQREREGVIERECILCIQTAFGPTVVVLESGHPPALKDLKNALFSPLKIPDIRLIPKPGATTVCPLENGDLFIEGSAWCMFVDEQSVNLQSWELGNGPSSQDCLAIKHWKLVAYFGHNIDEVLYEHPVISSGVAPP